MRIVVITWNLQLKFADKISEESFEFADLVGLWSGLEFSLGSASNQQAFLVFHLYLFDQKWFFFILEILEIRLTKMPYHQIVLFVMLDLPFSLYMKGKICHLNLLTQKLYLQLSNIFIIITYYYFTFQIHLLTIVIKFHLWYNYYQPLL